MTHLTKTFAALGLLVFASACGGSAPPPAARAKAAPAKPIVTAPASRDPLFVELVTIPKAWVAKYVPDGADDVNAWAASATIAPSLWWVVVRVDPKTGDAAAKAKAQRLLERTKKEPFPKVAREGSDDFASRERGGETSATEATKLPNSVKEAFAALKPGETSGLVKEGDAWHFVHKAPPSDDTLAGLYRQAKSGETATKLGLELTKRLRSTPSSREAIADSVQAILGDSAVADPARPQMAVIDRERIRDLKHLSAAAKAGLGQFADHARPAEYLDEPVADDEVVIVARAVAAGR